MKICDLGIVDFRRGLILAVIALGLVPTDAQVTPLEIVVLSNRADLISGGDALVEVRLPGGTSPANLTMDVDGRSVTSAFSRRSDGRMVGLVTGLKIGANTLSARAAGAGAQITITNHPIGGPVISGPQVQPWICETTTAPSLGEPMDTQCNAPTSFRFTYRTTAGAFAPFDPNAPRPADIATATTDRGVSVPYIVRIERGAADRGIHEIAVLADPSKAWAPWAPADQPGWNHKVYIPFGSGCEFGHTQGRPGSVMNDNALALGFLVMSSSNTQYGTHCNDVVSAETVMMLKEHVSETYGDILFTMATGGSGGAHQQNLIASNYPGLLQGIMPSQHFQDTWTPYREFADCGLLAKFYAQRAAGGTPWTEVQKAATDGHANASTCEGPLQTFMASRTKSYLDPAVSTGCGGYPWTWSVTNPRGERCTLQDYQIAVFGRRAPDAIDPVGYAKRPLDNVGVQYGLVALKAGTITPEMFVDLNAGIGCYDINQAWQTGRCVADPGAVEIAYRSGRVTNGHEMANVAMIDLRNNDDTEEHYNFRTYVTRARLVKANGSAANQAIWRTRSGASVNAALPFNTMNQWLDRVAADRSARPLAAKIIANRPTLAVDTCFDGLTPTTAAVCDDVYRTFTDTRVAAGEPATSDYMKCAAKPLAHPDYPATLTDAQWSRLQAALPTGVCDYSRPAVGQVTPAPWQTFADGPGGRPLGPPPVSRPVR